MGLLQVDVAGLDILAARCQVLAGDVAGVSATPCGSLPSAQATAAAVEAVHAGVAAAGEAMMARLETTAAKLTTAAAAFAAQETRSADNLAALTSAA